MTDINKLLNTTSAGQIAKKLDAKDGSEDGKIKGSVWNDFVDEIGTGKKISEEGSISVFNAMKSVTTYVVRQAHVQGKDTETLANEWKSGIETQTPSAGKGEKPEAAAAGKNKTVKKAVVPKTKTYSQKVQEDYNSVKVTVPKVDKRGVNTIETNKKNARKIANEIIEYNQALGVLNGHKLTPGIIDNINGLKKTLSKINKDNVIYVLQYIPNLVDVIDGVDYWGSGLDKDDVYEYVMKPLAAKLGENPQNIKNRNIEYDTRNKTTRTHVDAILDKNMKNWTLEDMYRYAEQKSGNLRKKDSQVIRNYNNKVAERKKAQNVFNGANKLLAEVANMDNKPKIESGHVDNNELNRDYKKITLPDGRWIRISYDAKTGEIATIRISYDTTPDHNPDGTTSDYAEVLYEKEKASFSDDHSNNEWQDEITSGYNFEKLKVLAKKIFG